MAAAFERAMTASGDKSSSTGFSNRPPVPQQKLEVKPSSKPVPKPSPKPVESRVSKPRTQTPGRTIPPAPLRYAPVRASSVYRWKGVPAKNPFTIDPSRALPKEDTGMEEKPRTAESLDASCIMTQCFEGKPVQELELVVGFDFGTSCSKVVIQDAYRRKAYAVPFHGISCKQNQYLLPARLYVRNDCILSLNGGSSTFDNLKVNLIINRDKVCFTEANSGLKIRSKDLIAGYIALVLRDARKWFWETHGEIYKGSRIIWQMNVGLPSGTYDDSPMLRAIRSAALAGWNLSVERREVTLLSVSEVMKEAERDLSGGSCTSKAGIDNGHLHRDMVQAVPEVIAEVIGYARSPMRRNGMFLLVDVGASTLDVSTFILHEQEGEDLYPLLAADVQQMGILRLHHERVRHIAGAVETCLGDVMRRADANAPLPDPSDYLPRINGIGATDTMFQERCAQVIARVVANTRLKRNPGAAEWDTGLPVFFCGGGAGHALYRNATLSAGNRLTAMKIRGILPIELPKPENLDAPELLSDQYHRLAVAYGLSFSYLDIGRIMPPAELEDIPLDRHQRDTESAFVSKEMV